MKVAVINGSPNTDGNTSLALEEVCTVLRANDIETHRVDIGHRALHGCAGCRVCFQKKNRRCAFDDDGLNEHLEAIFEADGLLIGSPVYFSGINGSLKCMLDRLFYVASANGLLFRHKVGAGVVAVRRGGEIAAWDQLNKFFTISEMFVPSGDYWNMVFGLKPGEAAQDTEGMHVMRTLGANMAWLLRAISLARESLPLPEKQEKPRMNFIR